MACVKHYHSIYLTFLTLTQYILTNRIQKFVKQSLLKRHPVVIYAHIVWYVMEMPKQGLNGGGGGGGGEGKPILNVCVWEELAWL